MWFLAGKAKKVREENWEGELPFALVLRVFLEYWILDFGFWMENGRKS